MRTTTTTTTATPTGPPPPERPPLPWFSPFDDDENYNKRGRTKQHGRGGGGGGTNNENSNFPGGLSRGAALKLFLTGATVGPVVDSLHNQCLLRYDIAPIQLFIPSSSSSSALAAAAEATTTTTTDTTATVTSSFLFCSSWTVLPLLGIAYVVLGGVLPRVLRALLVRVSNVFNNKKKTGRRREQIEEKKNDKKKIASLLRNRAILAVVTTAMIIKLSEILETHADLFTSSSMSISGAEQNVAILLAAALLQWFALDGTLVALLAASITGIGGPLSELPFVAHGFWHYLPEAADYYHPLADFDNADDDHGRFFIKPILSFLLGEEADLDSLGLSGITGPCYFAVTMDAIALGRWFDYTTAAATPTPATNHK